MNAANRASRILALLAFAFLIAAALYTSTDVAYGRAAGATPGRAGVPGTSDCNACHTQPEPNRPQGMITVNIAGLQGGRYVPGQTYDVTITLTDANQQQPRLRWGFEATAVFSANNMKAGTLSVPGGSTTVQLTERDRGGREYVTHTQQGTYQGRGSPQSWSFKWQAPGGKEAGNVTFYFCGIAGDNNSKETNDYQYCQSRTIQAVQQLHPGLWWVFRVLGLPGSSR